MSTTPLLRTTQGAVLASIVGDCLGIRRAVDVAQRFANTAIAMLLLGPTGSGKELFVQHVHAWSGRPGELVDVNCAALPRELFEGLLFGHRRGVFTGAVETAEGLIEAADGGTLLLDEVDSLPVGVQAKLLRVLETGEVRRLGETVKHRVDIRVIAAAQGPLGLAITAGRFRPDLYHRLAGVVISLPPLAERGNDVVLLAHHFAAARGCALGPDTEPILRAHPWPGNVRELAAAIERAVRMGDDQELSPQTIHEAIALGSPPAALSGEPGDGRSPPEAEMRRRLVETCEAHAWRAARIAAALAIGRTTLYRRLRDLGISLRQQKKLFHNGAEHSGTI